MASLKLHKNTHQHNFIPMRAVITRTLPKHYPTSMPENLVTKITTIYNWCSYKPKLKKIRVFEFNPLLKVRNFFGFLLTVWSMTSSQGVVLRGLTLPLPTRATILTGFESNCVATVTVTAPALAANMAVGIRRVVFPRKNGDWAALFWQWGRRTPAATRRFNENWVVGKRRSPGASRAMTCLLSAHSVLIHMCVFI